MDLNCYEALSEEVVDFILTAGSDNEDFYPERQLLLSFHSESVYFLHTTPPAVVKLLIVHCI